MSKRRKKNSRKPLAAELQRLRRQATAANLIAQEAPTHENLTRAFALNGAVKVAEAKLGKASK